MKLICTQENLVVGLSIISRVSDKQATLPILSNVLLRAQKDGLELLATNLELAIQTKIRGKIESEGEFTVNARLITDFVSSLGKENIQLEYNNKQLSVSGEDHQTVINGLEAAEFPIIPTVATNNAVSISGPVFAQALNQILFAMAQDSSRPELHGALLVVEGDTMMIVATDSFRLSEKRIPLKSPSKEQQTVIVPARTLQETARILELVACETVTLNINESQASFVCGDTTIVSRLISGKYPDYKNIIPAEFKSIVTFSVRDMERAVKTTSLFCKQGINDVRFSLDERFPEILIQAENTTTGKNSSRVKVEKNNQPFDIVFNYKFFLDGLQHLGSDTAMLKTNDAHSAALLTTPKETGFTYLIMPIRQ